VFGGWWLGEEWEIFFCKVFRGVTVGGMGNVGRGRAKS